MKSLLLTLTLVSIAAPLAAQSTSPTSLQQAPPVAKSVSLAGPRYGFTFLSDGIVDKLRKDDIEVKNDRDQLIAVFRGRSSRIKGHFFEEA